MLSVQTGLEEEEMSRAGAVSQEQSHINLAWLDKQRQTERENERGGDRERKGQRRSV